MELEARRVRMYVFSPRALVRMATTGEHTVMHEGIPPGAKVLGTHYDPARDLIGVAVEHETFDPVEEGRFMPEFTCSMSVVRAVLADEIRQVPIKDGRS